MSESFPALLRGLRRGAGRPYGLVALRHVDSTNRLGRRLLEELAADELDLHPTLLLAWEQTDGKGRQGRSWRSLAGEGVWASMLLRIGDRERLQSLPLVVGVALARGIAELGVAGCRLKWPNDLLADGRKIGGVLIETLSRGDQVDAVVGFGINLGPAGSDLAVPGATSVAHETGRQPGTGEAACRLADALVRELPLLDHHEEAAASYAALSSHRPGDRVVCRTGGRTVAGRFLGFTRQGFLRLDVEGSVQVVTAGEVLE